MAFFRQSMEALVNPFFLCLVGYLVTYIIICSELKSRKPRIIMGVIFVVLLMLSTGWIPAWITYRLEDQHAVINKVNPEIHYVVVLSGGQALGNDLPANSTLYSASLKRLVEAIRLYRALPNATLILSGGGYGASRPEASRLQEVAQWFSIPDEQIQLEISSINTADQAVALKKMVKNQPFYLVSSAIHLPRAMALFKKQGLNPIAAPTDFTLYWQDERWQKTWIPNAQNIVYFNVALHEILGSTWEKITGAQ